MVDVNNNELFLLRAGCVLGFIAFLFWILHINNATYYDFGMPKCSTGWQPICIDRVMNTGNVTYYYMCRDVCRTRFPNSLNLSQIDYDSCINDCFVKFSVCDQTELRCYS